LCDPADAVRRAAVKELQAASVNFEAVIAGKSDTRQFHDISKIEETPAANDRDVVSLVFNE
jgi:hypothetical protein